MVDRDEFSKRLNDACEGISAKLPAGTIYTVVAWNRETGEMHTWIDTEMDPHQVADLLEHGARNLRDPDEIRGGN